jgi:uncharacterized protein YqeY
MVEKLKQDMIQAMKDKDKTKLAVIRGVKAGMEKERIDRNREINDDLLIDIVNREIKMRKDSIGEFEKGGREDLVDQYKSEIDILMNYLPAQLSVEEINKVIDEIFAELKPEGPKSMGLVMKEASSRLKGQADMKEVSNMIKEKLSK